jgi:hypothetical protein
MCTAGTRAAKGKIGSGRIFSVFYSCLPYFSPDLIMIVPGFVMCGLHLDAVEFLRASSRPHIGCRLLPIFRLAGLSSPSNQNSLEIDSVIGRGTWHHTALVETSRRDS